MLACNGWQITTIEGLGNTADGLGKVQAAIAAGNATQCGFCTPGVIMSVSRYNIKTFNPTIANKVNTKHLA